jgi:hypothetical protein
MNANFLARARAAAVHFAISVLVVLVVYALVRFVYYPHVTWEMIGTGPIMLLLFAVDVVLGPLLTFAVFNKKKASLKMDLAVVVFIQLCALTYGVYTLWQGRPVYLAALGHRFDIVRAFEVQTLDAKPRPNLPSFGPKLIGTKFAQDQETKNKMISSALSGLDYSYYPEFHAPYESMRDEILRKSVRFSEIESKNPHKTEQLAFWLVSLGVPKDELVFQGLKGPLIDGIVAIRKSDAAIVGFGRFSAW